MLKDRDLWQERGLVRPAAADEWTAEHLYALLGDVYREGVSCYELISPALAKARYGPQIMGGPPAQTDQGDSYAIPFKSRSLVGARRQLETVLCHVCDGARYTYLAYSLVVEADGSISTVDPVAVDFHRYPGTRDEQDLRSVLSQIMRLSARMQAAGCDGLISIQAPLDRTGRGYMLGPVPERFGDGEQHLWESELLIEAIDEMVAIVDQALKEIDADRLVDPDGARIKRMLLDWRDQCEKAPGVKGLDWFATYRDAAQGPIWKRIRNHYQKRSWPLVTSTDSQIMRMQKAYSEAWTDPLHFAWQVDEQIAPGWSWQQVAALFEDDFDGERWWQVHVNGPAGGQSLYGEPGVGEGGVGASEGVGEGAVMPEQHDFRAIGRIPIGAQAFEVLHRQDDGLCDITVRGQVLADTEIVGDFTRNIQIIAPDSQGRGRIAERIDHERLYLDRRAQQLGFARQWLSRCIERYHAVGGRSMRISSADSGAIAWPKLGFRLSYHERSGERADEQIEKILGHWEKLVHEAQEDRKQEPAIEPVEPPALGASENSGMQTAGLVGIQAAGQNTDDEYIPPFQRWRNRLDEMEELVEEGKMRGQEYDQQLQDIFEEIHEGAQLWHQQNPQAAHPLSEMELGLEGQLDLLARKLGVELGSSRDILSSLSSLEQCALGENYTPAKRDEIGY